MVSVILCEDWPGRDAQAQGNHASEIACRHSGAQGVEPAAKPLEGQAVEFLPCSGKLVRGNDPVAKFEEEMSRRNKRSRSGQCDNNCGQEKSPS